MIENPVTKSLQPFDFTHLIDNVPKIKKLNYSINNIQFHPPIDSSNMNPSHWVEIAQSIEENYASYDGFVVLHGTDTMAYTASALSFMLENLHKPVIITGSNAKLLSGELATYLGGRYVEFVIYPFSFGEFMELYRSIAPDASIQQCFQKYLLAGGMPYLANLRYADAPSKQYLHDLFNSVQLKDIVKRNKIRDVDLLERIIAYVIANVGTTFSTTSLAKFLKNEQRTVAPETILNYIKYCCEAYLFYQVKREDLQGKQILASNEKYYIADHGIREAVFGGNMRDINLILENIVYLELLRRGYEVTVGRTGDKEIDFVCDKRGEKLYVQVTYLLASEETVNREFGAYDNIRDNFPKYVVSLDEFDMSRNGIKHRNIRDFLLAEEWN